MLCTSLVITDLSRLHDHILLLVPVSPRSHRLRDENVTDWIVEVAVPGTYYPTYFVHSHAAWRTHSAGIAASIHISTHSFIESVLCEQFTLEFVFAWYVDECGLSYSHC